MQAGCCEDVWQNVVNVAIGMCNVSLCRVLCVSVFEIHLLTCFVCIAVVWGSAVAAVIAMSKFEMTFTTNKVTKYYRAGGLHTTVTMTW